VENPVENVVNNPYLENPVDKWGSYTQLIHRVLHSFGDFCPQQKCDGNGGLSHLSTLSTGPITTTIILKNLRTEVKEFNRQGKNCLENPESSLGNILTQKTSTTRHKTLKPINKTQVGLASTGSANLDCMVPSTSSRTTNNRSNTTGKQKYG
jgi:hypothetical protein